MKTKTIQEKDWENHLKRLERGARNRFQERRLLFPKRKFNCRKLTLGRIALRKDVN